MNSHEPPSPIDWGLARRTAVWLARRHATVPSYDRARMEADFDELTAEAEELVAVETGLTSLAGPARARVADRDDWVRANVASFRRLLDPLAIRMTKDRSNRTLALPPSVGRGANGLEVGLLLGWMSGRVLGQYDQLLVEDDHPEDQDVVYYVGPNIAALEETHGFPPREFRLWVALHEVTHRAQFTGVPWMREHFLSLVRNTVEGFEPDPKRFLAALRRSVDELRNGRNPLDEGGLVTLVATPEQLVGIRRIGGLMSLLEGHGDVTMDRAGAARVPHADRFGEVLKERRHRKGVSRAVSTLIGLDAKTRQYEQGEHFIQVVEEEGGREVFDRVWRGPQWLPDWSEIRRPRDWLERTARLMGGGPLDSGPLGVPA